MRASIQSDWCPYKKRLGHRHTQRDNNVRTQGEDNHVQNKERDLRRNQPCRHFDLGLPAFRTERE